MFDSTALVVEEIAPEDKNRTEVLGARVALYMAAKKWDMAAAVASHLVKVEPENEAWWINLAYSVRRSEQGIEPYSAHNKRVNGLKQLLIRETALQAVKALASRLAEACDWKR